MADWSTAYQIAQQGFAQAARNRQARRALEADQIRMGQDYEMAKARLDQDRASQSALDAYRQSMVDAASKNFELAERRHDLDVDRALFDQDQAARKRFGGFTIPTAPGMPGPIGFGGPASGPDQGAGPRWALTGINADGSPSYTPVYGDGRTGYEKRDVPEYGTQWFQVSTDPRTGQRVEKPVDPPDAEGAIPKGDRVAVSNLRAMIRQLDQLEGTVRNYGTVEYGGPFSGVKDMFWNVNGQLPSEASAILSSTPYKLAIEYAKVVDPDSVAREGEVAAAQKYMLKLGLFSGQASALAGISEMRKEILERAKEMGLGAHVSGDPQPGDTKIDPVTGEVLTFE